MKIATIEKQKNDPITHAYVHWLADVHSGSFAPAFNLSFHDSELKISEANAPATNGHDQRE